MEKTLENEQKNNKKGKINFKSPLAIVLYVVIFLLLLAASTYGYMYVSSPQNIKYPSFDHYHFRTQIIIDGEPVDFSRKAFQEDISNNATSCSVELNGTPIDFHDSEDQMTHIHWGGITGGQFMKYYGRNLIGGDDDLLGRRYDQGMMNMHQVHIKGDALPYIPEGANFFIYIGNEKGYEQKSWNDFLQMDLEHFFGKESRISRNDDSFNILDLFSKKAYAHGGIDDGHNEKKDLDEATLERINNLIGNVVIFVQKEEPSHEQIKERFADLVPLHSSSCGG